MPIMRCAALVFLTTLPGTVNAEYFVEKTYNSTDCSVSMYSTMITMGMPGEESPKLSRRDDARQHAS